MTNNTKSTTTADLGSTDGLTLLQTTLAELASQKHSLNVLQSSHDSLQSSNDSLKASNESLKATISKNHHQVILEIEKVRNLTKKHSTQLSSLPNEVVSQIISWIHPRYAWMLRNLSKSFKGLLTSNGFASLNLSRFIPPPNLSNSVSLPQQDYSWDRLFFNAPLLYQSEYARKFKSHLSVYKPAVQFQNPLPSAWFPHLKNLTILYLNGCSLFGEIPMEIGVLHSLELLDLSQNMLTGEIPSTIGNLVNLKTLWLFLNRGICGMLPMELFSLVKLEDISLSGTSLMGPLPSGISNLKNLKCLRLQLCRNPLMSSFLWPELGSLSQLEVLDLQSCNLSGTIPKELGQLQELLELSLSDNKLGGIVPVELEELNLEVCELEGNSNLVFPFEVPEHWNIDAQ
ncbi:hypothetical protein HDU79_005282 [Rhizoclosmatium sp. JEL0117]|nr:hypothetical protein HDU79_005282 [Rhizoclosmatium sp. JEL0117]